MPLPCFDPEHPYESTDERRQREERRYEALINSMVPNIPLKPIPEPLPDLYPTRNDVEIWQDRDRYGNQLVGVKGDRSHTHIGSDFISIRAEDEPRVHLRWKRNPVTGEYE
jgi:hypothetical protein